MKNKLLEPQSGQAVVVIALTMIGMIAMLGLIFDGGNVYIQRRRMQNAADAAALAGGRQLAMARAAGDTYAYPVKQAVNNYIGYNGAISATMTAYYIDQTGVNIIQVGIPTNLPSNATGIRVTANTTFNTFFLGIMNIGTATASAPATIQTGPPSKVSNLFPIVVPTNTLVTTNMNDYVHCQFNTANNPPCLIWGDKTASQAGSSSASGWTDFHWCTNNSPTLEGLVAGTISSGSISLPDWICTNGGVKGTMQGDLTPLIGKDLVVPIFDYSNGLSGSNLQYHIYSFAVFKLTGFYISGAVGDQSCGGSNGKFICGKFERFAVSTDDINTTQTCPYGFCGYKMTE